MTKRQRKKKRKLNAELCPEKFMICVPKSCRLLDSHGWTDPENWERYVRELADDYELALPEDLTEKCYTCDCKPGWVLRRELAVAHACQVHDRIRRQLLSLDHVSAVDVGFAIQERQTRFRNFLAIRIHVNQKLPPEQLVRAGLTNFTTRQFAFADNDGRLLDVLYGASTAGPRAPKRPSRRSSRCCGPDANCPHPDRWRRLIELLQEELEDSKVLRREIGRYPISGVRPEDLSIFCAPEEDQPSGDKHPPDREPYECREIELRSLDDIRLCICGVPIDVVNAHYEASATHPGGDAASGVFVEPIRPGCELDDDEVLLIGRGRVNPLVGGVSVGSVTGQAGTLGAVVWDRTDGAPCVLSNWHVLAGTASAQVGQPTYQPALFDGGTVDDVVARLKRWQLGEEGDAALAELSGDRHYASGEIIGLWHPVSGNLPPRLNLEIRKWGRTTGFTEGFVDGIHLATNIDYGGGVVRYFRNQFHIAALYEGDDVSQVGDSGSLVVTSFKPVDMQEDLEQLTEWLRQACDNQKKLCGEIEVTLKTLKEDCPDECCKGVCDLLNSLEPIFHRCDRLNPTTLCDHLKKAKKSLNDKCAGAKKTFAFLTCLELELEKLLERCDQRRSSQDLPLEELLRVVFCCAGDPTTRTKMLAKRPKNGSRNMVNCRRSGSKRLIALNLRQA